MNLEFTKRAAQSAAQMEALTYLQPKHAEHMAGRYARALAFYELSGQRSAPSPDLEASVNVLSEEWSARSARFYEAAVDSVVGRREDTFGRCAHL